MMSHPEACTVLTRMEVRLHQTRHNLFELERTLRDRGGRDCDQLATKNASLQPSHVQLNGQR